jgi:MFS family permease
LMTLNVLFITVGQVVAYVVGWLFVQWGDENTAWRWIVGLGAVPAGVQSEWPKSSQLPRGLQPILTIQY